MTHSNTWRRFVLAGLLLIPVAVAAIQRQTDDPAPAVIQLAQNQPAAGGTAVASSAAELDRTDAYRLALLKIKGHLGIARALLQVRAPGADYHMGDPVRELFKSIEAELDDRNAPFSRDVLAQLEGAMVAAPQTALATIDSAAAAIDGSFAQTGPMAPQSALALSEILLREAVQHYADSVTDNEVVDVRGYRSGRGLVLQAEALVRHATGIQGQPGHEALLAAVVLIRQAWPGVQPPPIVFDPESVAARLEQALAALGDLR